MIEIQLEQDEAALTQAQCELIRAVVESCLLSEGIFAAEVSITITGDEQIRALNLRYRGVDKPTDVLSFPQYASGEIPPNCPCLGDIVISLPRTNAQARAHGHPHERELGFLTAHGLLHLLGHNHDSRDAELIMLEKQESILTKLGLKRISKDGV